ncbi:MAG TPA: hypothetical protein VII63_10645 [Caulobacteraceae bacterium]
MLFLLNDVVLDLTKAELSPGEAAHRYRRLSLDYVESLGAELFADCPRLQKTDPDRAVRLATMIVAIAPRINAALFVSPALGCDPLEVSARFDRVGLEVLDQLRRDQNDGKSIGFSADRAVWRRLAA